MLAVLQDFYGSMAQISFTLLGLWWVVVQFKYADFMKDRRRRLQTYDTSLYFVLPGIMSLISLLTTTGLLWRITFTISAILVPLVPRAFPLVSCFSVPARRRASP